MDEGARLNALFFAFIDNTDTHHTAGLPVIDNLFQMAL